MTLAQLLTRYRDEVSPMKRSAVTEIARINAILRRPICFRTMTTLSTADIAAYRDERLKNVAPATIIRELNTIRMRSTPLGASEHSRCAKPLQACAPAVTAEGPHPSS